MSAAVAAGCGAERKKAAPRLAHTFDVAEVRAHLRAPVHVTAPIGSRAVLYVSEQAGRVVVLERGRKRPRPFLDIRRRVGIGGEQGLFALAFSPDYARDRRVYVHYTDRSGDSRVVEYRVGGAVADPRSARELLRVDQPYENHKGGQLAFGPDGRLYLGLGDGGSAFDPLNRSQDAASPLGKLLRLDPRRPGARWEIVGYGLRNPWRFAFDRKGGDLYIGDVGQDREEEIDIVRGTDGPPRNFGWPAREGSVRHDGRKLEGPGRLVEPAVTYGRERGCSVTGGFVYRGRSIPGLRGRYVYGDFCSGRLWSFRWDGRQVRDHRVEQATVPHLASFGEDGAGELYAVAVTGRVYRLVPPRVR